MSNDTIYTLLSAVAAQGAGDAVRVDAPGALVLVTSASTSSATVLIQGSLDNSVWQTLKSVSNPAAGPSGSAYMGTAWKYMRANCSAYSSGTITAKMMLLDTDPGAWKTAEAPTATATDISVGTVTCTKILDDDLTSGRVVLATTSGELTDDAGLLYDGSYLTAANFKNTAGTATRVPYYGASKEFTDEAAFAYTAGTNTLAVGVVSGTITHTCTDLSANGAITKASGICYITKGGVCALTLADPSSENGKTIMIVSTTAYAHTITFNAGKINGGSLTTATFGGAIGDSIVVTAVGTVWYTVGAPRNVTIS